MPFLYYVLIAVIAYLLGSLNFSLIVSTWILKKDVRKYGSGNAGATNSLRVLGKKWALIISIGDFAKGIAATLIGRAIMYGLERADFNVGTDAQLWGMAIAGFFVVLGHCYPVFFHFRGGKGVWTTGGVIAVLDWRACLIAFGLFVIVVAATRIVSLGSITAGVSAPLAMLLLDDLWKYIIVAAGLCVIAIIKHKDNIKRLLSGTEKKISFHRQKSPE